MDWQTTADAVPARIVSEASARSLQGRAPATGAWREGDPVGDRRFVGIGDLGYNAPLVVDGFLQPDEMEKLIAAGATGEICGWIFDARGELLDDPINERVASIAIPSRETSCVIAMARGKRKHAAIRAAVLGGRVNALITDEEAARYLLTA